MLPISVFFSSMLNHLLAVLLAVAAVAFWDRHLHWTLLFLPLYTGLLGTLAVGIGWVFASLQVYLRDTAQGVMVLLTLWFWVTPIFINEEQIPEGMRFLLRGNPLSLFVKAYRARLLSAELPNPEELAVMAAWSCGAFVVGGLFFRYLKRGFADVL
jgi:ABC-type polysaccharide/polyol phosphate export permease